MTTLCALLKEAALGIIPVPVTKNGLKFEASAKTMHTTHLKDLNSTKKVAKGKHL